MNVKSLVILLTMVQCPAFASTPSGYDEILRELQNAETAARAELNQENSRKNLIRIHGAAGMIAGRVNLAAGPQLPGSSSLNGVEAVLGIDLFSRRWIAEGALRSFEPHAVSGQELTLREFDLRLIHQIPVSPKVELRIGGGMAARYLSWGQTEYSTPASILQAGVRFYFNHVVGISADTSLRSRLVNDTIDQGSFDATIRLVGSF